MVQLGRNDLDAEKKRNRELGDLLHEKNKQYTKIQVCILTLSYNLILR